MLVDKIRDLATDLRRIHADIRAMESNMFPTRMEEREVDVDQVIEDLNVFKLNVTYLRLKAGELAKSRNLDFSEIRRDVHYFVTYLKHSADTFDEICNSLVYGGRSGDEKAIQKAGQEIWILQRHLQDMNQHLDIINSKLGKS
jgi:hypothetical protein